MGMNVIRLNELTPDEPKTLTLDLLKHPQSRDVQSDKSRGQIVVEALYKPFKEEELPKDVSENADEVEKAPDGTPSGGGLLVVIVHEAKDLEGKHHTNPYVRVTFRGEEKKTKVSCDRTVCPILASIDPRGSALCGVVSGFSEGVGLYFSYGH
ncbi:hypothetical protein BHE74_00026254 [Ensete ventricosum]|nr:hypothetical protein GW17_00034274 [Ensete ventricosum]RWW66380.1 hypothetical protein BHE74_00026254 [Ensete ventricosum]